MTTDLNLVEALTALIDDAYDDYVIAEDGGVGAFIAERLASAFEQVGFVHHTRRHHGVVFHDEQCPANGEPVYRFVGDHAEETGA